MQICVVFADSGNLQNLKKLPKFQINKLKNTFGDKTLFTKIIYFGDHCYSDVFTQKISLR